MLPKHQAPVPCQPPVGTRPCAQLWPALGCQGLLSARPCHLSFRCPSNLGGHMFQVPRWQDGWGTNVQPHCHSIQVRNGLSHVNPLRPGFNGTTVSCSGPRPMVLQVWSPESCSCRNTHLGSGPSPAEPEHGWCLLFVPTTCCRGLDAAQVGELQPRLHRPLCSF